MSGKIEISWDLADRLYRNLASGEEAYQAQKELRSLIAAPVVERQYSVRIGSAPENCTTEPRNMSIGMNAYKSAEGRPNQDLHLNQIIKSGSFVQYRSDNRDMSMPPAPVAVVLPERDEFLCFYDHVQASGREPGMVNELHTSPPIVSFSDPVIQFAWVAWQARACLDKELNQ